MLLDRKVVIRSILVCIFRRLPEYDPNHVPCAEFGQFARFTLTRTDATLKFFTIRSDFFCILRKSPDTYLSSLLIHKETLIRGSAHYYRSA